MRQGMLPSNLPADPMPLFEQWFRHAREQKVQPNPDSMVVATATAQGRPSARVVLCKKLIADPGYVVFFTNYQSRKGAELDANPEAAAVLHWDDLARQVRLEGPVLRSPGEESDEYFASRALDSRIGAWASLQSQPLDSRATLLKRVAVEAARHGTHVPRPPHWGGFRLWPRAVELWLEGPFRVHDRARWTRELDLSDPARPRPGPWQATRLYP
ncbi:MAG TPA: pyridoxamine 5'-phosphate oxidase [Steroidobacteraceae bacterium]|nr:pyridoxamine 5'-phosphate oxidase [Steroidobacteraceae bacterium]